MADLKVLNPRLSDGHKLAICFKDESEDIMPDVLDKANEINRRKMKAPTITDDTRELAEKITVVIFLFSIIGIAICATAAPFGVNTRNHLFISVALLVVSVLIAVFAWFGSKEKFQKDEYDLTSYLDMDRVLKYYGDESSFKCEIVDNNWDSVVLDARYRNEALINLGADVKIDNDLLDDVIFINGHMDFNQKKYVMNAWLNKHTMKLLQKHKEEK